MPDRGPRVLMEHWIEAWSTADTRLMQALFVDDCTYELVAEGSVYRGKQELRELLERGERATAGLRRTPTRIVIDGDAGAMEYRLTGGSLDGGGATRRALSLAGLRVVVMFVFEAGHIKCVCEYGTPAVQAW